MRVSEDDVHGTERMSPLEMVVCPTATPKRNRKMIYYYFYLFFIISISVFYFIVIHIS